MKLCKSQVVSSLPQLQPTSVLLPGWHLATSFGSSDIWKSCFPLTGNWYDTVVWKKSASHLLQSQFRNQGFPIGVSGVIVWHQPKHCITINIISYKGNPSKSPLICIVWSPQNGWHLKTPAYWRFPFWLRSSSRHQEFVTWSCPQTYKISTSKSPGTMCDSGGNGRHDGIHAHMSDVKMQMKMK